jgi:hypothetical protein
MIEAILWISRNHKWIYLLLASVGVLLLWLWWSAQRRLRRARFGIERAMLINVRARAVIVIFMTVTLMAAVLLLNVFVAPNLTDLFGASPTSSAGDLAADAPAPTPTTELVLPGFETPTPEFAAGPTATLTPVPVGGADCLNPQATITSPIPGAILAGEIEVSGTADVDNFAFYVVEISTLGDNWLTVLTSQPDAEGKILPVVNGLLGKWNTALQAPGDYALRLVVKNSSGDFSPPCTIPITVTAPITPSPTP